MPASRQRSRSPCMAWAVMAMMGMSWSEDRGSRVADAARRLEAVHLGHLHVHEHQVVGDRLESPERFGAVGHGVGPQPQLLQDAEGHLLVGDVVLGQQDAHVRRHGRISRTAWRVTMGRGRLDAAVCRPATADRLSNRSDCRIGLTR